MDPAPGRGVEVCPTLTGNKDGSPRQKKEGASMARTMRRKSRIPDGLRCQGDLGLDSRKTDDLDIYTIKIKGCARPRERKNEAAAWPG